LALRNKEEDMPAFGKNGIVNIKNEPETTWQLVKPDGTVVMSGLQKDVESAKERLSNELNCQLIIKTSTMRCI
jgi:hypothetical protein